MINQATPASSTATHRRPAPAGVDAGPRLPGFSLMFAPVGVGRELLGYVLLARDATVSPWTPRSRKPSWRSGRTLGRVVLNARLYERERQLVGELQELDRYKGELIATISHELKTPLTSIIGSHRAARGPRHRHRLGGGDLAQRGPAQPAGRRTCSTTPRSRTSARPSACPWTCASWPSRAWS